MPKLSPMTLFRTFTRIFAVLALAVLAQAAPLHAAEEEDAGVGYGGAKVQLNPLMVPARGADGTVRFEVLSVRLILDKGPRERPACFSAPIVHERFLMYLYDAKLTPADFIGQRRDVLAKKLLEVAIGATAKGYYSGVEILNESSQAMDPKSQTLSNQCK